MLNNEFNIAALVAKYLTGSLSDDESRELESWKEASEQNHQLFASLCDPENQHTYRRQIGKYDKTEGWNEFQHKIKTLRRRRLYTVVCQYAAIFLLPMAAGLLSYYWAHQRSPVNDVATVTPSPAGVEPGKRKAILTLGNGMAVELTSDTLRGLHEAGTQIEVQGDELTYSNQRAEETDEPVYNKIEIPRGGEYKLSLSDGSVVYLNAMTSLRYPVHFKGDIREVELSGEAYFDVSQSKIPFIVKTAEMDIRVLGTSFNVSAYPDNASIQTTLLTGAVQIQTKSGEHCDLKPSQQAEFNTHSLQLAVRQVNATLYSSWIEGKIHFKDERLEDIMTALARWYDVNVIYENGDVRNLRFGCHVNRYENITPFLDLLMATGKVRSKVEKRNITFY